MKLFNYGDIFSEPPHHHPLTNLDIAEEDKFTVAKMMILKFKISYLQMYPKLLAEMKLSKPNNFIEFSKCVKTMVNLSNKPVYGSCEYEYIQLLHVN